MLHTIENNFALGASLGVDDTQAALSSTGGCYNQNAAPNSYTPILANLDPTTPNARKWGIAALQRYSPKGEPYYEDLNPPGALQRYFADEMQHDRACVDECSKGAL